MKFLCDRFYLYVSPHDCTPLVASLTSSSQTCSSGLGCLGLSSSGTPFEYLSLPRKNSNNRAPITAPITGPTMYIQSLLKTSGPPKKAGPRLRAGFILPPDSEFPTSPQISTVKPIESPHTMR